MFLEYGMCEVCNKLQEALNKDPQPWQEIESCLHILYKCYNMMTKEMNEYLKEVSQSFMQKYVMFTVISEIFIFVFSRPNTILRLKEL